jgi:hypothetical protein
MDNTMVCNGRGVSSDVKEVARLLNLSAAAIDNGISIDTIIGMFENFQLIDYMLRKEVKG